MNFATMIVMALMVTVHSTPVTKHQHQHGCPDGCRAVRANGTNMFPHFQVSDELKDSSVAPWEMIEDIEEDREPPTIMKAVCKGCSVDNMIAKPISIKVSVYKRVRRGNLYPYCKCPYQLPVACTCVKETPKMTATQ